MHEIINEVEYKLIIRLMSLFRIPANAKMRGMILRIKIQFEKLKFFILLYEYKINSNNNSENPINIINIKFFKFNILLNKIFDTKSLKKSDNKEKITAVKNTNKADLKINSYFSSELFILGTIAIIPLGILNPTIEVNRDTENITCDQKPISL